MERLRKARRQLHKCSESLETIHRDDDDDDEMTVMGQLRVDGVNCK